MFIKKWFAALRNLLPKQPVYDVYHPRERMIYTYFDGKKEVKVDPLILYKKVLQNRAEISINSSVANSASKDNQKAQEDLLQNIRDIFNLKPLAEGGLTEIETLGVLDHFLIYTETIKKNSSLLQTSSTYTAASTPTSEGDAQPTSNSSDSGSIASAPATASPPMSPTASVSPLASSPPDSTTLKP